MKKGDIKSVGITFILSEMRSDKSVSEHKRQAHNDLNSQLNTSTLWDLAALILAGGFLYVEFDGSFRCNEYEVLSGAFCAFDEMLWLSFSCRFPRTDCREVRAGFSRRDFENQNTNQQAMVGVLLRGWNKSLYTVLVFGPQWNMATE